MMGSFPTEILQRIFEHLETPISLENWEPGHYRWDELPPPLSHLFHRIARPLIYRTVALRSKNGPSDSPMDKFMHVLCADPSIGHNIQGLQVEPWLSDFGFDHFALQLSASPENLDERQRRWLNMWTEAGNRNVALVALVAAPRLQTLDYMDTGSFEGIAAYLSGRQDLEDEYFATALGGDSESDNDDVPDEIGSEIASGNGDEDSESGDVPAGQQQSQLLGPASENPMSLLSEVRVGFRGYGNVLERVQKIEGVLLNPGLRILRLSAFRWTKYEVRAMKWNNVMSNITTLQLKNCLIDERGLANALRRCRLRHLHIALAGDQDVGANRHPATLDLNEMGVALRRYGQSLESLDFDSTEFGDYIMVGHIGPLNELSRLRNLKICLQDLGEFDEEDEEDELDEQDEDNEAELEMELRTLLPSTLESIHIRPSEKNGTIRVPLTLLTDEVFRGLRTVEVEGYVVFQDDTKTLEVPGWSKSFKSDMFRRDDMLRSSDEPAEFDYFVSVHFSRDAEVR
ncbi:unnamed protein product [Clonostachys rhizophaga]|uniref:Uncharacterized protein n=1 Tax=Clonostachys rhizophaga TaxID=160324 RepID=A0A9N9YGP0_9HYPO|nr:unnamed protein product [Clonostachys rhizophaga]